MSGHATGPIDDVAVAAICRHMNADHADDCLEIVTRHSPWTDVVAATVRSVDHDGASFEARRLNGTTELVHVSWRQPAITRGDIRAELVDLCSPGSVDEPSASHSNPITQ